MTGFLFAVFHSLFSDLTAEGKVLLRLRRPWSDGTRAIRFAPSELLEKLAAMIPKPRINLLVYHGVFAPHARGRQDAVRRAHEGARHDGAAPATGEASSDTASAAHAVAPASQPVGGDPATPRPPPPAAGYVRPRYYAWATLLERTFAVDVLACPAFLSQAFQAFQEAVQTHALSQVGSACCCGVFLSYVLDLVGKVAVSGASSDEPLSHSACSLLRPRPHVRGAA